MLEELNNDSLVNHKESPNANIIYHLYSDGNITSQKGGWAYGQRSEFIVASSIDIKMNLDIDKFKYLLTTTTTTFGYIIVSEENGRLIRAEMVKLTKML
jgi:hypothetical protein